MNANQDDGPDQACGADEHIDCCGPVQLLECLKRLSAYGNDIQTKQIGSGNQKHQAQRNRRRQSEM